MKVYFGLIVLVNWVDLENKVKVFELKHLRKKKNFSGIKVF